MGRQKVSIEMHPSEKMNSDEGQSQSSGITESEGTTTAWTSATFNHTWFPIPHNGSVCGDCHQVSTDYPQFTCVNCYTTTAHQQTWTGNTNQGVKGYTYGAETCYNCHKNGGEG